MYCTIRYVHRQAEKKRQRRTEKARLRQWFVSESFTIGEERCHGDNKVGVRQLPSCSWLAAGGWVMGRLTNPVDDAWLT